MSRCKCDTVADLVASARLILGGILFSHTYYGNKSKGSYQ